MKITASIVMYSGLQDPEMDVSPEIATDIIIKLNSVFDVSDKPIKQGLGYRGYSIWWQGDHGFPYTRVRAHGGIIQINSFCASANMKDTINLEGYLKELMAPTLKAHFDMAQEEMDRFYEALSRGTE